MVLPCCLELCSAVQLVITIANDTGVPRKLLPPLTLPAFSGSSSSSGATTGSSSTSFSNGGRTVSVGSIVATGFTDVRDATSTAVSTAVTQVFIQHLCQHGLADLIDNFLFF